MKKIITLSIIIIMTFALLPDRIMAGNSTSYTILVQKKSKEDSRHNQDLSPVGNRMPPRLLPILISQEGLSIPDVNNDEIILYEVIDQYGTYLATFTTEAEFISFIFMNEGSIEIRIYLDEYILQGYLSLQ